MKDKAIENYTRYRCNCAESVAMAWRDTHGSNPDLVGIMRDCGHGRAPGGLCGALYAACQLAGTELAEEIQSRFRDTSGGAITCREIRKARVLRCVDCVGQAASLLDSIKPPSEKKTG